MRSTGPRLLCLAILVSPLSPRLGSGADDPEAPWWGATETDDTAAVTDVLGSPSANWLIVDPWKRPVAPVVKEVDGRTVIVTGKRHTTFQGLTDYGPGTQIEAVLRLNPAEGQTALFNMTAGATNTVVHKDGVRIALSYKSGADFISGTVLREGIRTALARPVYRIPWLTTRSLNWPEPLRRQIEHNMAVPPPEERWLRIRWVLLQGESRVYMDDRLAWRGLGATNEITGKLRLDVYPGTELAAVSVARTDSDVSRYDPVRIDGYANASDLKGAGVARASLPPAGQSVNVEGVPFVFAEPGVEGRDHIDVGESWMYFGYEGQREGPRRGPMGGRWAGALSVNPARIQLRVPGRRYSALHLVAAADGAADSVPVVTAQFYRPAAGRPMNFRGDVPLFTATSSDAKALPVELADGSSGNLYLVTIPINPGDLVTFDDLDIVEVELTKEVVLYRAYPDPYYYSFHGAGLPSGVHVYAATFELPEVGLTLTPSKYAHVWTAPERPVYTVALTNSTKLVKTVVLQCATASSGGAATTAQKHVVRVNPHAAANVDFTLDLQRYGQHSMDVEATVGAATWTERRKLAYLHEDTRERGDWERGRGPMFGFWNWGGGHYTPPGDDQCYVMYLAGAEGCSGSFGDERWSEEQLARVREFKMTTFKAFSAGDHWHTSKFASSLEKDGYEVAREAFLKSLRDSQTKATDITRPTFISFFAEPHIGYHTSAMLPEYYGEPPAEYSEAEEERFQMFLNGFIEGARIVKEEWPDVRCNLPHGDPLFPIPFIRRSEEARKLIGGITVDIPCFERLPEMQIHQVCIHRMYATVEEFKKAGNTDFYFPMYEGPALPTRPGGLDEQAQADLGVRNSLILLGYHVDIQTGGWSPADAGSYWGEQHYGGGIFDSLPMFQPKPSYCALATMTRHLNRRNLEKWIETGSRSVYCLQFKHYKTGSLLHVLWTLRGTCPVTLHVPDGASVAVYDGMDNLVATPAAEGKVTFAIGPSPVYVEGLPSDVQLALGDPDHTDAVVAEGAVRIGNLGDGTWQISGERDPEYEESNHPYIVRYPGKMSGRVQDAPETHGGKALAVHLERQEKDPRIMPFYTAILPAKPIPIGGKASHIGLWAKGASDWGRVVYFLRDASGEKWISIGQAHGWNCDDTHSWSHFCYDGWRYLRFEMPSFAPYDMFREMGTTWWGAYGKGDAIVDLPLSLEKIVVERRTHVMYVNDPQPASTNDVLLADLYVEYADPSDNSDEVVGLSRLRMPVPRDVPDLANPIDGMAGSGELAAITVRKITLPEQQADGTRCYVHFDVVEGAKQYDVWASPYETGVGALQVGKAWTEPGQLVRGLRAETDFYLYVTYTDADGKVSKPSPPFKVNLKDVFAMK